MGKVEMEEETATTKSEAKTTKLTCKKKSKQKQDRLNLYTSTEIRTDRQKRRQSTTHKVEIVVKGS